MEEKSSKVAELGKAWRSRLTRLLYTSAPWILTVFKTVSGGDGLGIQQLTEIIKIVVEAVGGLMIAISLALFAAGLILKHLPFGSQRTKDFGGQLFDHGLILAALASIGGFLLSFAGQIATWIVGQGEAPTFSGPWRLSS